ncbi:MAG: sensor histidine kinase [Dehalococcoidia bacterium]
MFLRSIRLRLALWYFAILAVILVLFSGGIYFTLRRALNNSLDDSLRTRATLIQGLIDNGPEGQPTLDISTNPRDPNQGQYFQRLLDPSGAVLFDSSAAFGKVPIDMAAVQQALQGSEPIQTVGSGETQARILSRRIEQNGHVVSVLQVGQSMSELNGTLNNLLLVLAIGAPLALVFASLGGWWLSTRALAPIDRVTKLAQEITGHDLSRRLNLDLPNDEVGRLARTFDEMIARLDAMFQRQRQFTADASHELRTPLTAIKGQIDVALQRPRDPAAYQEVLAGVNEQVDRMTRLVGGLLMLARSDAGALPVERQPVNLRDLVESVAEQVEPLAHAKGLVITTAPGASSTIVGDEDLLLQLMLNLADNAVKYTEAGTITLGWETRPDEAELFVRDTGPGVPEAHRARIFERFHRVDDGRARDQSGAGLGLAICRWIAEAHGGRIRVDSSPAGSSFVVTLPRRGPQPARS